MAAAAFLPLFSLSAVLLFSPALSLTCTSQTFSDKNTHFTNCTDLPVLKAYLHWSYNPSAKPKPTLSVAFIAPPAQPNGWVAWALNPTGTGMAGAQSLLAFKDSNGSVVVKTFNISSYSSIVESKLLYDVLDKKAEFSDGVIKVFATLALPENLTTANQIWQVGAGVKNGMPEKHEFAPDNLNAKGVLVLSGKAESKKNGTAPAPAAPTAGGQSGNVTGGSSRVLSNALGLYGTLLVIAGASVLGF